MKKYIFTALIMLASIIGIKAQDTTYEYALLLNKADGTTMEFDFKYYPVLTFEGDEVIVNDYAHTEGLRYDMGDITNLTIKRTPTGVEAVADAHVKVSVGKEALAISGLQSGAQVTVCDLSGRIMARAEADGTGQVSINISDLNKGVFIVSMPGHSFKFIR